MSDPNGSPWRKEPPTVNAVRCLRTWWWRHPDRPDDPLVELLQVGDGRKYGPAAVQIQNLDGEWVTLDHPSAAHLLDGEWAPDPPPATAAAPAPFAALRLAEATLVDLHACDDPACKEPNCNHALVAVRAALEGVAAPAEHGTIIDDANRLRTSWDAAADRVGRSTAAGSMLAKCASELDATLAGGMRAALRTPAHPAAVVDKDPAPVRVEGVVIGIRPHSKLALVQVQVPPDAEGIIANDVIQIRSDGWNKGQRVIVEVRPMPATAKEPAHE